MNDQTADHGSFQHSTHCPCLALCPLLCLIYNSCIHHHDVHSRDIRVVIGPMRTGRSENAPESCQRRVHSRVANERFSMRKE